MWGNKQKLLTVAVMLFVSPSFAQQKKAAPKGKKSIATKTVAPVFVKASFPGGQKALDSFLLVSIHYPVSAKEAGVRGRVVVQFMIDEKGRVTDPKLTRGIGAGCDEEAKRVVMAMPKWEPATYKKKPVKMMFVQPVSFRLE